jgi:hypothetical protein
MMTFSTTRSEKFPVQLPLVAMACIPIVEPKSRPEVPSWVGTHQFCESKAKSLDNCEFWALFSGVKREQKPLFGGKSLHVARM